MCQPVVARKRSERSTKLRLAGIRRAHPAFDKRLDHHQYRLYLTTIVSNNINHAVLIFRCYSNITHKKKKFRFEVGNIEISTVIYRGASVVLFILCSPYVGTLVASQTTARNCQKVIFVKFSTVVVLVLLGLLFGALTIASRWRCSTSGLKNDGVLLVKLQYQTQNRQDYLLLGEVSGNIRKKSSSSLESFPIYKITSFTKTADVLIRLNSSKLALSDFLLEKKKGSDTSVILNGHYHHHPHKKPLIYHLRHSKNRNPSDSHNSHYHLHNSHYDNHKKTDRFRNLRTKREYLSGFDNVLGFYREEKVRDTVATPTVINHDSTNNHNHKISNNNNNINNSGVKQTNYNLLRAGNTNTNNRNNFYSTDVVSESDSEINNTNVGAPPDKLNKVKNAVEIVDGDDRDVSGYDLPSAPVVPAPPSVRRNFQFESSTQRSMPPVHVSENSLSDSSVLVLVVSVVVLTVTLGLVTCVLSHYRGGTAANSHDAAQAPTTAPMLSVVSAGTAAGVGGMDRLRSRGTARELAATRERQVRVHTVHTDTTTTINLPPSIALPDGEDHPFNSRLQIRDAEQEAEIYQKCIKPPPNRTVLESESPPPYRSSSAGLLGSISGSSSGSTDWSAGSGGSAPLVVRCHSMSSTSKRQPQQQQQENSSCSYVATTTSATAGGFSNTTAYTGHAGTTIGGATIAAQKTDFIQRTVKRFTGSKDRKNQPSTLQTSSNASGVSSANMPVVIVPTKPRRISEQSQSQHSQLLLLQSQNQQQQHQQHQQQQNTTNTTTGRPRPNV